MADPAPLLPFRAPVFSFLSRAGAASLHAHGRAATDQLAAWIDPKPTDVLLDVGCGTGHTLAVMAGRYGCKLHGVDAHPDMLTACRKRMRHCRLAGQVQVHEADFTRHLPFDDATFDAVYGESVLAFQNGPALAGSLREIHRVLKPGGRLWGNETLWLPDTPDAAIVEWNRVCLAHYGIPQAAPDLKGAAALIPHLSEAGFEGSTFQSRPLSPKSSPLTRAPAERRSLRFTRLHTLAGYLHPALLKQRLSDRKTRPRLHPQGPLMAGVLYAVAR